VVFCSEVIQYILEKETYKIEIQDRLNINFPFHPQFSSSVLVRSDGQISLPLVGDVMAAEHTTEQLDSILRKAYAKYIRNPSLTVSLQEFNVKIDELKRAITTAPRGQSKIAPVAPDGRISLPIIGNIQASGFTLRELEKIINDKYTPYVNNLQATLILEEIRHMNFYIFGEVARPGVYAIPSQGNLLDALALAEGFTPRANLAQVLVFRSDGLKEPIVFMVDAEAMLKQGFMLKELTIRPADIVYIPKDWLSEANDLIEKVFTKGIYGILPFQSNFSVNYDLTDVKVR
jgi:polysaccharide biosynthesis/export protein